MSNSLVEAASNVLRENKPATVYNDLNEKYSDGIPGPKSRAKIKKNVKKIWRSRGFKKSVASDLDRSSKEDTKKIRGTQKIASTVDPERKAGVHYVGGGRAAHLNSGEDQLKTLHGVINRVAARRAKKQKISKRLLRDISEGRKGATGPRQRGDQFGVGQSAPNDNIENNTFFKSLFRRLSRKLKQSTVLKFKNKKNLGSIIGEEEIIDLLEEACILGWINENVDSYCDAYGETRGMQQLAEDVWTSHGNQLTDLCEAGLALPKGRSARKALLKKYDKRSVQAGKDGSQGRGSLTKGRTLAHDVSIKYGVLDSMLKKLKTAKRMGDDEEIAFQRKLIKKKLPQAKSRRRMYGKLTSQPIDEEQEINELSKKTLGSYVNASSKNAALHAHSAAQLDQESLRQKRGHPRRDSLKKMSNKFLETSKKRLRGIEKASEKLSKE